MNTSDFAQRLADKLIAQLQEGTAPWQKPWIEGQSFSPYNPTTGNRYRGVNILALISADYTDPRWMTYKQAQAQGEQVRGERSTQIQHWIWEEERVHANGVPNGYAENNRTKQIIRWKATGQYLSSEAKADLVAQAERKRYVRKQTEGLAYGATATRLAEEMREIAQ